ncbi:MAG: ATP synthase F1 subunit epsilon [Mariprofundaceae bacterium]|nr:ATP synthase F1 subunit epsilon [Mariprofundaceae bacterium]
MDILITTVKKEIYRHRACSVTATTAEGELKILPSHAPLLAVLRPGVLIVECMPDCQSSEIRCDSMVILGGFIEVQPDSVIVLADSIERADDLNEQMAIQAVEQARKDWDVASRDAQKRQMEAHIALEIALAKMYIVKNKMNNNG